jgi:S1-C subfamily serine protease
MICFRLDKQLLSVAKDARCIYTRYADDITFSSYQPLSALFEGSVPAAGRFSPELLATNVKAAIAGNGFSIHPDKAHYADRHSRRMVTGLKINEILNVDRRFVRNIRSALHSVEKDGLAAQKRFEAEYGGRSSIAAHLAGKISWLGNIKGQADPVFRGIAFRFNQVFPDKKLKVTPTPTEIRDRSVWVIEHGEGHETDFSQGTAFFLKEFGLVTAAHCVNGKLPLTLYHPTKTANRFIVAVSNIDKHRDLAVLSHDIPTTEFFELEVSSQEVKLGSELTAVGYPGFGPGDGINVRSGHVSSLPVKSAVRLIEVSQKLVQGMSGGPMLDSTDKVVGVIHKGGPNEGRDFAIHVAELASWMSGVGA